MLQSHPYRKKSNLDKSVLSNFRPISILQISPACMFPECEAMAGTIFIFIFLFLFLLALNEIKTSNIVWTKSSS